MATPGDLAARVLRKLKVTGLYDTAEAEETQAAIQGVRDAHAMFDLQGMVRWTLQDIPSELEFAYVQMAAYILADDFLQPKDAAWAGQSVAMVGAYVNIPVGTVTYSQDF